jgi:hypothetical protein
VDKLVLGGAAASGSETFQSKKDFSPGFAFTSYHRIVHSTGSDDTINNLLSFIFSHDCSAVCEAIDDLSSRGGIAALTGIAIP